MTWKQIKHRHTSQVRVNVVLSVNSDERSQKLAGQIYRLYNEDEKEKAPKFMLRW